MPAFVAMVLAILLLFSATARATTDASCEGPATCCPPEVDLSAPVAEVVRLGLVLVGISEVNEKASSWTADYYLYETWHPAPGFVPQTEVVNEIERKSVQFDVTELRGSDCMRTRRLHSVLRTAFNLRTFPFDVQSLVLEVSDAEFPVHCVRYDDAAVAGISDAVLHQLAAWKVAPGLRFQRATRAFRWDPGAPDYDYATFAVTVRRHVSFHLEKYFLPLLLIVIVSFTVFWIDSMDLSSSVQVTVTCLLATVALQLTEGSELPDVSYLTIADRAFATSYVAIALAVVQVVYTSKLARCGKELRANQIDRWSRWAFPVGLIVALSVGIARAYAETP